MGQGSILIVDDNAMLLSMVRDGLSAEGYSCETAASAKFALELIQKTQFDLMVTDIDMPEMNGLELTKRAKRIRPDIKIIIMTGLIDKFSWDEAIEAGALDFIKKPFTVKELIARMKQVKMHEELQKSEKELKKKVKELEEFYEMAVGRELRMKELKEEIEELKVELEKYKKQ
jgi:DNA-binding NtrC family response regulator